MAGNQRIHRDDFTRWLKERLKDKGLQPALCGSQTKVGAGKNHEVDLISGGWVKPNYSGSKPPRWLYPLDATQGGLAPTRENNTSLNVGGINASQGDKAAAIFRVVPLIKLGENDFFSDDALEVQFFLLFHGPTPQGSSSEAVRFNPDSGEVEFKDAPLPYISAGLLGIQPRDQQFQFTVGGVPRTITYGDVVDVLAADITVAPQGRAIGHIPVFDLSDQAEFENLKKIVLDDWQAAGPPPAPAAPAGGDLDDDQIVAPASLEIPELSDLLGIDPAVYRQINAALASGKQHIMLYGPPGTGKTTLARHIATVLTGGKWTLVTGSSDWSSQDIIGGYQPVGEGSVAFIPGVLLRRFDRPLIIDELNRCDIDKVIGPLFTVLSGQQTTLPYRLNIEDKDSAQFTILPESKATAEVHEFAPGPHWRLLATINSIDKAALYQMSYALARRFGWVYVDAPRDTTGFIEEFLRKEDATWGGPIPGTTCPLGMFWAAINQVRVLGPAPVIDAIKAVQTMIDAPTFFAAPDPAMKEALLDAVDMVLLPMLDGIIVQDADFLTEKAIDVFALDAEQSERIKARMASVAV